jgi:hypothetical protein
MAHAPLAETKVDTVSGRKIANHENPHLAPRISALTRPAGYVVMLTGLVSNIAELGDLYSGAAKW